MVSSYLLQRLRYHVSLSLKTNFPKVREACIRSDRRLVLESATHYLKVSISHKGKVMT
jgi:hypothetical protein